VKSRVDAHRPIFFENIPRRCFRPQFQRFAARTWRRAAGAEPRDSRRSIFFGEMPPLNLGRAGWAGWSPTVTQAMMAVIVEEKRRGRLALGDCVLR
jgi:hypothetical protein